MRFVALVLLFAGGVASGGPLPPLDRRAREEPEVVVEAGGRVGTCDVLTFAPDGTALLAAGDDKVVRVWPVAASGALTTSGPAVKTLRWPAWREQRGGIKAIAVSPDGQRVAVGGFGMRQGTIAILGRDSGELQSLTWAVPPKENPTENYHSVTAIAFRPDGKQVAFGTSDGSLWLWDPAGAAPAAALAGPNVLLPPTALPVRVAHHEPGRSAADPLNRPVLLAFVGRELLSIAESGEGLRCDLSGAVKRFDLNAGRPADQRYGIYRALLAGDRVIAACRGPALLVQPLDGQPASAIELAAGSFPRSIAYQTATDRLAVGVGNARAAEPGAPRFFAENDDEIRIYSNVTNLAKLAAKWSHAGPAEALAFHPSADRLAVAGGDADEVSVVDPTHPAQPTSVVRGAGQRIWGVGISANGRALGIRPGRDAKARDPNHRAAGPWYGFDLTRLSPIADVTAPPAPVTTADGWSVQPDPADRFVWHAEFTPPDGGKSIRQELPLNRRQDQAPTCFVFLPKTPGKPTRLLVGHYYGASLFELTPTGATRTRLFIGHAGEVAALAAAPDQQWFVTAGADQTIAAYSLADFEFHPALGASLKAEAGKIAVGGIAVGSPAWEMGLTRGATIDLVAVDGKLAFDASRPNANVDAALEQVNAAVPGREIFLRYRPAGANAAATANVTTIRQRPLWKLFPTFAPSGRKLADWVVWVWKGGFYHTTSANGDRLVGWHVNHPQIDGTPAFRALSDLPMFHRPGVVEALVQTRDLKTALEVAAEQGTADAVTLAPHPVGRYEPAPVRLDRAEAVAGDGTAVTVTVEPRGTNPDCLAERVELWVNDFRYRTWQPGGKPVREAISLPASLFRSGVNRVTVQVTTRDGARASAAEEITAPGATDRPALLALAIGINNYSSNRIAAGRSGFGDLKNGVNDATALASRLDRFRGPARSYVAGKSMLKLDADARKPELEQSLAELARTARPDDTLVVFFAGHGDLLTPANGAARPGARGLAGGAGTFVLCGPDYAPARAAATGLAAEDLFERLARINCRKVVLLDACHSGRAAAETQIRELMPVGQGPFVIAACDQSELSYEHPKLAHGIFTYAVLEALGDKFASADADRDGALAAAELFGYVSARVPELLRETGQAADTQTPVCSPRTPPVFAVVR